jgi:hypothetical protein
MSQLNPGIQATTELTFNSFNPTPDMVWDEPGLFWLDLDTTLGYREFVFVQNAGASSANTSTGQLQYWIDNYKLKFSNSFSDAGTRNTPRGVATGVINNYLNDPQTSTGYFGWLQILGYIPAVNAGSGTFAFGTQVISDATAGQVVPVANGTAPPYKVVGVALAVSAGSPLTVPLQLELSR